MNRDVRMKGFSKRTPVAVVTEWIDNQTLSPKTEKVHLRELAGRVTSQEVVSNVNVPDFPRAMMDGFAVRCEEIEGATSYNRIALNVLYEVFAGDLQQPDLAIGSAARIMTGAPVPPGANAVIPVEQTEKVGEQVFANSNIAMGKNIAQIGEDIRANEPIIPAGRRLRPQDLGVLSSIGVREADCFCKPKVLMIVTGNELLGPGSDPQPGKTIDSNSPMASALVARDGGELTVQMVGDDQDSIRGILQSEEFDVILVSGGSSVGQRDFAPQLISELGELNFHGIAMRPSSPAGVGKIANRFVFLLPGNPVSCLCAYEFFAGRLIRRLAGFDPQFPHPQKELLLSQKIVSVIGRVDYARVFVDESGGVVPIAISGASILSSATRADGFVVVPQDCEGYGAGEAVSVYFY